MSTEDDNPNDLPLNEWQVKVITPDGSIFKRAALHKDWTEQRNFTECVCMVNALGHIKTGAELEEWRYKISLFIEDMQFLLLQRQHVFWSYLIFQSEVLSSIVTFLQNVTPFYKIKENSTDASSIELYKEALALVVRIIKRVLCAKESSKDWIRASKHCDLIYENYLISVPMLFDLVIALGNNDEHNVAVLQNIFTATLNIQPKYKDDIKYALNYFESAFSSIQIQVNNDGCDGAGGGARLETDVETPYDDVVLYTLDCAYSLSVIFDVCPQLISLCDNYNLPQSIANFYDSVLPKLYKQVYLINPEAQTLKNINDARQQFLNSFRSFIKFYVQCTLQDPESTAAYDMIDLLTECLSSQAFVVDYQRQFPVEIDINLLQEANESVKEYKVAYIISGYQKAVEHDKYGIVGEATQSTNETNGIQAGHPKDNANNVSASTSTGVKHKKAKTKAAVKKPPPARDLDSEVASILDVLPDLGTGFLRKLLVRYDNSEQALAAIFDENLPPDLINVDRTELYIPPDPQSKVYAETGVHHSNIYNGDAYDVMTQDKPNCIIKRGKGFPSAPQTAEELLDDKRDIIALKDRYQKLANVEEDQYNTDEAGANEYEDEYDDSYEALIDGQPAPVRKTEELKQTLANVNTIAISESEASEHGGGDDNDNNAAQNKNKNFCENPEVIRARHAAKQQAKWGRKYGSAGADNKPKRSNDVVGAPKGQGQSKDTQRNRNNKEAHKATRANHNRKSGAAYKRSKGMLPS